jgi:hypothetical protein
MERSNSWLMPVAIVALAIAVGFGLWKLFAGGAAPPAPARVEAPAAPPPAAEAPAEPAVEHPLPGEPPQQAMQAPAQPPGEALAAFRKDLATLGDEASLSRWFDLDTLVRRVVSTVDNLASDELPMAARAIARMPGAFAVKANGDEFTLDPANARRYEPFVRWVESVDTRRAVELYVRHYRLFQGEYRGQGSPGRYFNDRLVGAIDHLLATPDVKGPIRLVQPKVLYRFADPDLERLSAGQKAMIRIGPENAARLKAKLRSVRAEIVREGAAAQAATR